MQKMSQRPKKDINKSQCSPVFQRFIDIANLIGPRSYLPTRNELVTVYSLPSTESLDSEEIEKLLIENYKTILETLENSLNSFVFSSYKLTEIEERISFLRSIQVGITTLAYAEETGTELVNLYNRMIMDYPDQSADLTVRIYLDENGFLRTQANEFLKYITDNNIQGDRIRLCRVCRKIFWAKRLESQACSKGCSTVLRQWKWRKTNREEYNEKRRRNYAYNKSKKGE